MDHSTRRGYTLVEAAAVVVVLAIIACILLPMADRARLGDGLAVSLNNVRTILVAQQVYTEDHAGQIPMRGHGYANGQITGGWDTWNFGGKNCSQFWQTYASGVFDEPAYARPLAQYLTDVRIHRPVGYTNTGSGSTWNFVPGTPSASDRQSLEIEVFRSPRDQATRQRLWPNPTNGVSAYDDVGTSYFLNIKWWDQQDLAPLGFTARFNEGVRRVALTAGHTPSSYVWIHDQVADVVSTGSPSTRVKGEYGGVNMSVLGFIDGRAEYRQVTPSVLSGPGYTFLLPLP